MYVYIYVYIYMYSNKNKMNIYMYKLGPWRGRSGGTKAGMIACRWAGASRGVGLLSPVFLPSRVSARAHPG